jgi:hypothetical protein
LARIFHAVTVGAVIGLSQRLPAQLAEQFYQHLPDVIHRL